MSLGFEKTQRPCFDSLFHVCFLICVCAALLLISSRVADAAAQDTTSPKVFTAAATIPATSTTSYGLEWPGDGAVRRMLYWHNPFPIYDATYIFRVYPRKKTVSDGDKTTTGYYTTFFWGNDGSFEWDTAHIPYTLPNTYYGAHPYPTPAPNGPGQWEISVYSKDVTTGTEVEWDRWYTQAFRAWRESPSIFHHEFYWDWPDTTKVISVTFNDSDWAARNPPTPAIVMGQAPDRCGPPPGNCGASWGGYPGWEEFNGVIRGIQIYSGLLSLADIQAEIAAPKSSAAGTSFMWYLNLDPRPTDVTDKKVIGTSHDPSWDGTTALEWSQVQPGPSGDTTPPSVPTGLKATAVSPSQINLSWHKSKDKEKDDAKGKDKEKDTEKKAAGYRVFRDGNQIADVSDTSYSDTGLAPGTTYSYYVRAYDTAGNVSDKSESDSATTFIETAPPKRLR
jgi:hypothetical protein